MVSQNENELYFAGAHHHGAFFEVGIPFGYFGVEDHPHYHKPTDTFETIPQAFYQQSV